MSNKRKPRIGKLNSIGDCRAELGRVYRCARRGELDSLDGLRLARILFMLINAIEGDEFESRIFALEAQANEQNETF